MNYYIVKTCVECWLVRYGDLKKIYQLTHCNFIAPWHSQDCYYSALIKDKNRILRSNFEREGTQKSDYVQFEHPLNTTVKLQCISFFFFFTKKHFSGNIH